MRPVLRVREVIGVVGGDLLEAIGPSPEWQLAGGIVGEGTEALARAEQRLEVG